MRLRRNALAAVACLLVVAALMLAAEPALAKSSLGIGTAEVTAQPTGPFAGLFTEINAYQRSFFTALREALVALKSSPSGLFFLVGLSFVYGVFHAAGPGHGKAVISAYMLANEVQLKRGIVLSFVSALLQAGTAILVVGAGWFILRGTAVSMTEATDALEIASYALIVAFGAWLLAKKVGAVVAVLAFGGSGLAGRFGADRAGNALVTGALPYAAAATKAGPNGPEGYRSAAFADPASRPRPIMRPASGGLRSEICSDEEGDCDCGRMHMPDPAALGSGRLSLRSAASAVLAVGLRPCSGAIVVLSFALLNGLYLGGLLSVLAMAIGTALTVSAIAAMAVFAKGAALRFAGGGASAFRRAILPAVEIIGALLVLLLGIALLGGALQ